MLISSVIANTCGTHEGILCSRCFEIDRTVLKFIHFPKIYLVNTGEFDYIAHGSALSAALPRCVIFGSQCEYGLEEWEHKILVCRVGCHTKAFGSTVIVAYVMSPLAVLKLPEAIGLRLRYR